MADKGESLIAKVGRVKRNTTNEDILDICDALLSYLYHHTAPPVSIAIAPTKPVKRPPDSQKRNDYMRGYMRDYRKRATK